MPLPKNMPTRDPKSATPDNPHSRAYSASRGGHVQTDPKPVAGKPKRDKNG